MSGAASDPVEGARVGESIIGRYRLLKLLGTGGMGEVYEAEHLAVGKRVALKCLWPMFARDAEQIARFEREARVAGIVRSTHVVDVLDAGRLDDGAPFLVMELLEGTTLGRELGTIGRMPVERSLNIVRQMASGLGAAHAAGIIHRDLKPENVFLVAHEGVERVKILDFGVSKFRREDMDHELTRTGTAIGTPTYMSPEQSEGMRHVDARADVWSLGVILFRMLTGELPFAAESYARLLMKIISEEPSPRIRSRVAELPHELDELVARCLAKSPSGRFASMAELAAALPQPGVRLEPGSTKVTPSPRPEPMPPRSNDSETRRSARAELAATRLAGAAKPRSVAPAALATKGPVAPIASKAKPSSPPSPGLPFDEVVLTERGGQRRIPADVFFTMPLSERIRHVIARTVVFLDHGVEVDRQEALARMRERSSG